MKYNLREVVKNLEESLDSCYSSIALTDIIEAYNSFEDLSEKFKLLMKQKIKHAKQKRYDI